ncbi:hypothetical protein O3M35_006954 [Rhynocoris fuscipes]|uniref:Solute carrier family 25 member 44 n=1 Tax=Rhynocoris fuscipes TaxID=488301 RepID=A0AAW1DFL4_9HEMI
MASMDANTQEAEYLRTIEWEMMDKWKFFPLSMLSSFSVRCSLYPLTLIKTRLQIQKHDTMYSGLFDAGTKIYRREGFSGLYRGFWVSSIQIFSGVCYIATYESSRHMLANYNMSTTARTLISGGVASLVGQTIIVPFDVISQHLMFLGLAGCKDTGKNPPTSTTVPASDIKHVKQMGKNMEPPKPAPEVCIFSK